MPKFLISLLTELVSVIGGGLAGSLSLVVNIMQKGFGAAVQFHQEGIALARDLGLSASQAQAYTQALTESTIKLANKYGVTADAIKAVQRGISESTGRQLLLNDAQREQLVIADKLVGAQTRNQFTAEIMNHLGGQVSTVEGAISKAYATAAKQGLNAQKFSETVAKNLSMANKLSFRDGVNGIIRMTALSEKLGFNLQSVESAANKFMELDSAIESSAQLQMLGGAAGAYGSNPLTMAYEANYDPEAFTERMTKMLGGYAQFDTKTGMANVNGMNRDFVKNIAQAMGISMDEAMTIAKKNAEVKFKENQFSTQLTNRFGSDEATKNYILNNSTYNAETKQLELNGRNINEYTDEEIAELKRMSSMSDHDLMVEQAKALTSLPEQINGAAATVAASFAKGIEEYIPGFREQVREIGNFLSGHAKNWGQSVGQILSTVLTFLKEKGPKILETTEKIFNGIDKLIETFGPIVKWITENPWESLFIYIAGKAALKTLIKHPKSVASGVGSAARGIGRAISSAAKGIGRAASGIGRAARGIGRAISSVAKGIGRAGSSLFKAIGRLSSGIGRAISSGASSIGGFFTKAGNSIVNGAKSLGGFFTKAGNNIVNSVSGNWLNKAWNSGKNAVSKIKIPGWTAKGGRFLSRGLGSVMSVAGIGMGVYDIYQGGEALDTYNDRKKELDAQLASGAISKAEYDAQSREALVDKRTDQGRGIGAELGGVIGAVFGGVQGASLGAFIGGEAGDLIGTFYTDAEEAVKGFWNGTVKDAAQSALGDFGGGLVDGIGDIVGGVTGGVGNWIENSLHQVSRGFDGTIDGFKQMLDGDIIGGLKTFGNTWMGMAEDQLKATAGLIGGMAEGAWDSIKDFSKGIIKSFFGEDTWKAVKDSWVGDVYSNGKKFLSGIQEDPLGTVAKTSKKLLGWLGFAEGGVVQGNSYSGDKLLAGINSGEMVLTKAQQAGLFGLISNIEPFVKSVFGLTNDIKAKPVGEREYIYTPSKNNNGNGVTEVTVRDINLNINGTLKLDAGTITKNLDINQLLSDTTFISSLKDLIKQSINNDINNGRFMNDIASMRGMPSQVGLWGRK